MIDVGMGYVGAKTNPGRDTNIIFDGLRGIGPTGRSMVAHGQRRMPATHLAHHVGP
eukprot:COSAG01_NODE_29477_length_636_cov_1.782123_1_plen_56_part_00